MSRDAFYVHETKSIQHNHSAHADSSSPSQEIPSILYKPNVHHRAVPDERSLAEDPIPITRVLMF
jgi:hypothetical protein